MLKSERWKIKVVIFAGGYERGTSEENYLRIKRMLEIGYNILNAGILGKCGGRFF